MTDKNAAVDAEPTDPKTREEEERVNDALANLANRDLAHRLETVADPIRDRDAWRAAALARRQLADRTRLRALVRRHPDMTVDDLVAAVELRDIVAPSPPPLDRVAEQVAFRAQVERNRRRATDAACPNCGDAGWVLDETNTAHRCRCEPVDDAVADLEPEPFDTFEPLDDADV